MHRVLFALVVLVPGTAAAVNGATPRTPPAFGEPSCITLVDRSVDPVLHIPLGLPYEDAILTDDELPDSRTLQLFAACRPEREGDRLPMWITTDDAARSLEAMLIGELPPPSAVLETASAWSMGHDGAGSCALPLVAIDARIALTCDAVEPGVDWDTTAAPAGNYVIYGYTFEPAVNLWTRRAGVVQVVDAAADPLPAVALLSPSNEATAYEQSIARITGCALGPAGTTVTLAWAPIVADDLSDEAAWTPFAELGADTVLAPFEVDFDPPPAAAGQALVVRARAQDAAGRAWTDVAPGTLLVYPGPGESDPPEAPLRPDACGSAASESESSGSTHDSGDAESGAAITEDARACRCNADRGRGAGTLLVVVLALRRRGRCAKVPGRARASAPA